MSAAVTAAVPDVTKIERFAGSAKYVGIAGIVAVVGLVLTGIGFALNGLQQVAFSYLTAFVYWCGISIAGILMQAIFFTFHAKWMVVLRRPLEAISLTIIAFAVLILPIFFLMPQLFIWTQDAHALVEAGVITHVMEHHLHMKQVGYLNVPFFVVRQIFYFAVWALCAILFWKWSTSQDLTGDVAMTAKARKFGPGMLPLLALTVTFAGFDWLMSLEPLWFSTIFGAYYFAGSFLACFAVLTIAAARARGPNLFGTWVSLEHFHNLGKLLLAFTAFWAYIGFSQYFLIWIANIPEESLWVKIRTTGVYFPYFIGLFIAHFVIPFAALLSRTVKLRPRLLSAIAVYILVVHYLDLYWLIMPVLHPDKIAPSLADLGAFLLVGGISVAVCLTLLRGRFNVPVKDPYLKDSLRYVQP